MQQVRIEQLSPKKLVGKSLSMSLANNRTVELWSSFMPHRKQIKNSLSTDFYSMQVYEQPLSMRDFTPQTIFEKWAGVEVSEFEDVPEGMKTYDLKGGLYAVFIHRGLVSDFQRTMQYIHGVWLPQSKYDLDQREHFELLGDKYKRNDPSSEEEVWVPIKLK